MLLAVTKPHALASMRPQSGVGDSTATCSDSRLTCAAPPLLRGRQTSAVATACASSSPPISGSSVVQRHCAWLPSRQRWRRRRHPALCLRAWTPSQRSQTAAAGINGAPTGHSRRPRVVHRMQGKEARERLSACMPATAADPPGRERVRLRGQEIMDRRPLHGSRYLLDRSDDRYRGKGTCSIGPTVQGKTLHMRCLILPVPCNVHLRTTGTSWPSWHGVFVCCELELCGPDRQRISIDLELVANSLA